VGGFSSNFGPDFSSDFALSVPFFGGFPGLFSFSLLTLFSNFSFGAFLSGGGGGRPFDVDGAEFSEVFDFSGLGSGLTAAGAEEMEGGFFRAIFAVGNL